MTLTPSDIQNKEFTKSGRKGYDASEVTSYLNEIVTEFNLLLEENTKLKETVFEYESKNQEIEEMKQSVTQSILVAQEAADRLKKTADESAKKTLTQAQDEGSRLINEATVKSNDLLDDAKAKSNELLTLAANENEKIVRETDAVKKDTREFKDKSLALLQAQIDLISGQNWEELTQGYDESKLQVTQEYVNADVDQNDTTKSIDTDKDDGVNSNVTEDKKMYILMPDVNTEEKF